MELSVAARRLYRAMIVAVDGRMSSCTEQVAIAPLTLANQWLRHAWLGEAEELVSGSDQAGDHVGIMWIM